MKIRGNAIGTTMKPENNLVKAKSMTDEQKERVRKNFDAMQNGKADSDLNMDYNGIKNLNGIELVSSKSENVEPASVHIKASPIHNSDGTDVVSGIVEFYESHHDGQVVLRHIDNGIRDNDSATVGQLNAAVGDIETTLNRKTTYTNLYGKVEITADDIIAAGDEGITCITIGSDDVDMSKYDDILIKLFVPDSSALNSANGMMGIYATNTSAPIITGDPNSLIRPTSANISTACFFNYNRQNILSVKTEWTCDIFHHGLVIKNGYSNSFGYAGVTNGWTCISPNYVKSTKRYFHIIGDSTGHATFKFPAGTYVEVFAR